MYIFKLHGKEYRVRFTYRTICKGDVLDKFTAATDFEGIDSASEAIDKIARATIEVLIAGLQKYHFKEFGYKDEADYEKLVDKFYDFLDDYEDESTDEEPKSAMTLLKDLQEELEKNGFLSAIATSITEAEEVAQAADTIKTEMEKTPARVVAMNTTPTESES